MKNTKIEWAHHSVNFWWGCVMVSLACQFCYAELLAKLFSRGRATWGKSGARWIRHEKARQELYALDRSARKRGVRERVFINSMSDTFEDRADLNEARERLFDSCHNVSNIDMLLLTKRPENVRRMAPKEWLTAWPAHVWVGTTVENQDVAYERIWPLLGVPAKVRFLSCEPLLGPIDLLAGSFDPPSSGFALTDGFGRVDGETPPAISWVIVGGESGAHARPMHPGWAVTLRDQCREAGVSFFFKQWGEWAPSKTKPIRGVNTGGGIYLRSDGSWGCQGDWWDGKAVAMDRVGKKEAGRLLGVHEYNEVPGSGKK